MISEMINIQLQNNALNQQTDTEYLQDSYISIINKINSYITNFILICNYL